MKKVSIIIPCYNICEYVARCYESLARQTYPNMEFIFIDDGSEDDTGVQINRWKNIDNRIIYRRMEHVGVAEARNCGLNLATGDYLMFVDGDDFLSDDYVVQLVKQLEDRDADISISRLIYTDQNGIPNNDVTNEIEEDIKVLEDNIWREYMYSPLVLGVSQCLFDREVIGNNIFPKGRYYESTLFMARVMNSCRRIVKTKNATYFYRQREGSITHMRSKQSELDLLRGYCEVYQEFNSIYPDVCHDLRLFIIEKSNIYINMGYNCSEMEYLELIN